MHFAKRAWKSDLTNCAFVLLRHCRARKFLFIYPSAPYDTVQNCGAGKQEFKRLFPKDFYISITYPEGHQED